MTNTEPVLTAAGISGFISAAIMFARLMGWFPLNDEQFNGLMVVLNLGLPLVTAMWARDRSTPVANPKDIDGVPLVRPGGREPLEVQRDLRGKIND